MSTLLLVFSPQASIELTDEGDFIIHNEGKRPLYLSGNALLSGGSAKLSHNQTLEVSEAMAVYSLTTHPPPSSLFLSCTLHCPQIASMSFLVLLNSKLASTLNSTAS